MTCFAMTLAPIRILVLCILWPATNIVSMVGLIGVSDDDLRSKPLEGWRRKLQDLVLLLGRSLFFCLGVHRVRVIGKKVRKISSKTSNTNSPDPVLKNDSTQE